jgi:hypothetical protein
MRGFSSNWIQSIRQRAKFDPYELAVFVIRHLRTCHGLRLTALTAASFSVLYLRAMR